MPAVSFLSLSASEVLSCCVLIITRVFKSLFRHGCRHNIANACDFNGKLTNCRVPEKGKDRNLTLPCAHDEILEFNRFERVDFLQSGVNLAFSARICKMSSK